MARPPLTLTRTFLFRLGARCLPEAGRSFFRRRLSWSFGRLFLRCWLGVTALDRLRCPSIAQVDRSARLVDLFSRRGADLVHFNRQRVFQFASTQNLDSGDIATHQLRFAQHLFVYYSASFKSVEIG